MIMQCFYVEFLVYETVDVTKIWQDLWGEEIKLERVSEA